MDLNRLEWSLSNKTLIILNVIGVIYAIALNILSNALPLNNKTAGEISDSLPNLFAPPGYVFAIWLIIYIGWIALILFLAFGQSESEWFLDRINIWLFVNFLLNGIWLVFWHYDFYLISVLVMIGILLTLMLIYHRLEIGEKDYSSKEMWLVQFPISIYFGWITVATIANITAYLVSINVTFNDLDPLITVFVLLTATLITLLILYTKQDIFFALVPIWAFIGINIKQSEVFLYKETSSDVASAALVFSLIIFALTVNYIYDRYYKK